MPLTDKDPANLSRRLAKLVSRPGGCTALLVMIVVALIASGCAIDQDKLGRTREDLRLLCEKPATSALRAVCERAGYLPAPLTDSD